MPVTFLATQLSITVQDGVLRTALAGPSTVRSADDDYLLLQLTLAPTPQDIALGMAQPHLEYGTQHWSWYGEIECFELFDDRVVATMSPAAAAHMKNDGILEAVFDFGTGRFAELKRALQSTFHGCDFFIVRGSAH